MQNALSCFVHQRALCALACLMSSDLLSLEQIYSVTHKRLAQVSQGTPGPVTNKATKVWRGIFDGHPECVCVRACARARF